MLDKETEAALLEKVGKEATEKTKAQITAAEIRMDEKANEFKAGLMSEKAFEDFKKEQMEPINVLLKTLEAASKEQGTKMTAILEKATPNSKSLEQFIEEQAPKIEELRKSGKYIEFTGKQLKAAGINSIAGAIPVASPYAPGIGGPLEIFDIIRNPNFITSKIDLGTTNQSRLAWANELDAIQGGASANIAEGGLKPQIQHQFSIETSVAKKAAGWIELTEEFEQDLPNFAANVRRQLQTDVERAWDDQIQIDVQNAAHAYEITTLNGQIQDANRWDAIMAFFGQVGSYNFIPNTVAINWITNVMLQTKKAETDTGSGGSGEYLLPPFLQMITDRLVFANKMQVGNALVGDLKQYHVDIYKDFVLKIGWINDELIYNKFAIVGELRYHSYISTARKKAITYDSLSRVASVINGTGSI